MKSKFNGKNLLIGIGVFVIIFDLMTIAYSIYSFLGDPSLIGYTLSQGFFRLLIEIALVIFCYKGHAWAKWILCIILLFSSIILLLQYTTSSDLLLLFISIINLLAGALLFTSPLIKSFMNQQISK